MERIEQNNNEVKQPSSQYVKKHTPSIECPRHPSSAHCINSTCAKQKALESSQPLGVQPRGKSPPHETHIEVNRLLSQRGGVHGGPHV